MIIILIGQLVPQFGTPPGCGCVNSALVGGIASGSLHGWLWLVAGFCGSIVGVYVRIWLDVDKPMGVQS